MMPKSQFSLPKSGKSKLPPPKKVNAALDAQSDAAVGMPTKAYGLPKSGGMKSRSKKIAL
jgi:hypothetical protein